MTQSGWKSDGKAFFDECRIQAPVAFYGKMKGFDKDQVEIDPQSIKLRQQGSNGGSAYAQCRHHPEAEYKYRIENNVQYVGLKQHQKWRTGISHTAIAGTNNIQQE